MKNIKKILIQIIIIIIILFIIFYNFFVAKNNTTEFIYSNIIVNDFVEENEIRIENTEKIKVYIIGEINSPGVIELNPGDRIEDAINLAGGITNLADLSRVNLAYCLEDGQKVYIPNFNDKNIEQYITTENGENVIQDDTNNSKNIKININTGDINALKSLPGVGDSLAQKIITYRDENGKFKSIDDLKNVNGIGEKKFESLKEFIYVK